MGWDIAYCAVSQPTGEEPKGRIGVMTAESVGQSSRSFNAWDVILAVVGFLALVVIVVVALAALHVPLFESFTINWPSWMTRAVTPGHKLGLMMFAIAVFVAITSAILLAVDKAKAIPNWAVVAAFMGPALVITAGGLLYPMIRTLFEAFFDKTSENFVGLGNFAMIFSDPTMRIVVFNTVLWVALVPLLSTSIGLVYAVLVDRTRFENFAKTLVFLPMAISLVGASVIWKFVYEYRPDQPGVQQIGLANQLLVWTGSEPHQFFLTSPWNSLFLIVVMIWVQTGFAMTMLSSAIKNIPEEITEAARLDGASGWQLFLYITIPSVRPAIVVVLVTVTMTTLKAFDIVRTMTGGNFNTSVIANEYYTQAFRQYNTGLSAALAVLIFIFVIPISIYQVRQLRLAEASR